MSLIPYTGITVEFSAPRYSTIESTGFLQGAIVSSAPLNSEYQVRVRFSVGGGATATSEHSNCCHYSVIIYFMHLQGMWILMIVQ